MFGYKSNLFFPCIIGLPLQCHEMEKKNSQMFLEGDYNTLAFRGMKSCVFKSGFLHSS